MNNTKQKRPFPQSEKCTQNRFREQRLTHCIHQLGMASPGIAIIG
jgi:hypothetical protein